MRRLGILVCIAIAIPAATAGTAHAATVPGAPTHVTAVATDAQARVRWVAPASDGGSPITAYHVSASGDGGQSCTWTTGPLTCIVTGLLNGVTYTFTVRAENAKGLGPQSSSSNAVAGVGAPPPPTSVTASAGDQQATVSCGPPVADGGSPITSYTATATPGGAHASAPTCPITITGLIDGTSYTFTVTATSNLGTSQPSAASAKVTPVDTHPPTAPGALSGHISSGTLLLTWGAATDNVGVVRYEISLNGKPIVSVTETTASLRAFEPHGSSVYTVTAFDAAGNQSPASSSVAAHPAAIPKTVPKNVPNWTWKLLAWQRSHKGARPQTPTPLPKWYAAWKQWRTAPFVMGS